MDREDFKKRRTGPGNLNVQWAKLRDPLHREDQLILDDMFQALEIHKGACNSMPGRDRFAATVVSMLIEQRKKSTRIEKQIEDLEQRINGEVEDSLLSTS